MRFWASWFWWFLTVKSKKSAKKSNRNPNTKGVKCAKFASVIQQAVVDMQPPLVELLNLRWWIELIILLADHFSRQKNNFRKVSSPFFISHRCNFLQYTIIYRKQATDTCWMGEMLKKTNTPTKIEKRNRIIVVLQKLFISL